MCAMYGHVGSRTSKHPKNGQNSNNDEGNKSNMWANKHLEKVNVGNLINSRPHVQHSIDNKGSLLIYK